MECKFCSSNNLSLKENKINGFEYFICNECELEFFINDDKKITDELYKNDIDYINDLNISQDYNSLIQWNHLEAFKFIKNISSIKTILDVGTYNGFFVKFLIEKNMDPYGFDFNKKAIESGILNYNLKNRLFNSLDKLYIKKFDCITAFEIIEHLEDPKKFIQDMRGLLKENGYIIISSPNNKMLWRPPLDTPPHHLLRISPKTLSNFVDKLGFETIVIYEQMSLFDLIRNYIGVFFRDNNSLKGGAFKNIKKANVAKKILNKVRPIFYLIFFPIDKILHFLGYRYISQVVIAKKK